MATKLELEEFLYRRAIDIIESTDTDSDKENLLFQEVWLPLASIYREKVRDEEEYISFCREAARLIPEDCFRTGSSMHTAVRIADPRSLRPDLPCDQSRRLSDQ